MLLKLSWINRCEGSREIFASSVLTVNYTAEMINVHIMTHKTLLVNEQDPSPSS